MRRSWSRRAASRRRGKWCASRRSPQASPRPRAWSLPRLVAPASRARRNGASLRALYAGRGPAAGRGPGGARSPTRCCSPRPLSRRPAELAPRPRHQQLRLPRREAVLGRGSHQQRRRRTGRGPVVAGRVEGVVDPGQRPLARVGVDRVELPVRVGAPERAVEAQEGQARGQPEQVGEVLVGLLLPAARPDQLEMLGQLEQVSGGGGRKKVGYAVDRMEGALWPEPSRPRTARSRRRSIGRAADDARRYPPSAGSGSGFSSTEVGL